MYHFHCIDLARGHQQALLAEAAHEQLVQEALRSGHSARSLTRTWSLGTVLHRVSNALGFVLLTRSRVG